MSKKFNQYSAMEFTVPLCKTYIKHRYKNPLKKIPKVANVYYHHIFDKVYDVFIVDDRGWIYYLEVDEFKGLIKIYSDSNEEYIFDDSLNNKIPWHDQELYRILTGQVKNITEWILNTLLKTKFARIATGQ